MFVCFLQNRTKEEEVSAKIFWFLPS